MHPDGRRQLINARVLRYKNSGRLIVHGGYGYYLDLDKSLQFTSSNPHKVNPSTELEETDWLIEFELEGIIQNMKWKYVRSYSVHDIPICEKSDDSFPLEERINISPSDLLNTDESIYIQDYKSPGSWKKRILITAIIGSIAYYINATFGTLVIIIGLIFSIKQLIIEDKQKCEIEVFNQGVDKRRQEVLKAKENSRLERRTKMDKILSNFKKWEMLDGESFEVATGKLFKRMGYSVEYTPKVNDGGIDLILEKDTERVGVQCKAYNKNVGIAAVRELNGIKSQWTYLNKFILVGLHGFTSQAKQFAKKYDIELFSIERDHFNIG